MAGTAAFGTKFCLGSTHVDQAVANLTNISGPGISADTIDVTAHDSADTYREFVAGVIDGGEIRLEGNLVSAAAGNVIMTELNARKSTECAILLPTTDDAYWKFDGIVTAFETEAPYDGKIGFSSSVKVTGKPTLA